MQPSTARSETRLPRAVQAQMAAIEARRQPAPGAESGTPAPAEQPAPPATAAAAASTATPAEPPVDPRENDPGYWRQRFQVTSGLLSKERQESKSRQDQLAQQVADLTTQVRQSEAPKPGDKPKADIAQFFTPEQIKLYGPEQCEVMAQTALQAAQSEAQRLIDAAVQPLKERQEREAHDAEAARKQKFIEALIAEKPNYEALDVDPRWITWLQEDDENTGVRRQQILNTHVLSGNAKQVARMMTTWERSVQTPQPPVAPSGSGAAPAGGDAPVVDTSLTAPTDQEVRAFYTRAGIGKVTDAERVTFEARMKLRAARRAA
jgi:hypothetical protein